LGTPGSLERINRSVLERFLHFENCVFAVSDACGVSLSQESLAKLLNINQAAVSKMERRTDMYISTLRDYIRAMGGELEIIATFPDGQVKIDNFAY
jgi:hypothetical protein